MHRPAFLCPAFLCDEMLAGLARWLRAAGYDALLAAPGSADAEVVALAVREGRLLLTRDGAMAERRAARGSLLVLEGQGMEAWAAELAARAGIDWLAAPFTRCLVCNLPLRPAPPECAAALPPRACGFGDTLQWCPGCGRLYWPGSHVRRMRSRLARWQAAARGADG